MQVTSGKTEGSPQQQAFTIEEGARFFGRHVSWLYRRIYRQDVKVINTGGRLMISRKEIDRLLGRETNYTPRRRRNSKVVEA
jgi:hypothetical protein